MASDAAQARQSTKTGKCMSRQLVRSVMQSKDGRFSRASVQFTYASQTFRSTGDAGRAPKIEQSSSVKGLAREPWSLCPGSVGQVG